MRRGSVVLLAVLVVLALTNPSEGAVLSASGTLDLAIGESENLVGLRSQFDPLPIFVSSGGGSFVQPDAMFEPRQILFSQTTLIPGLGTLWDLSANVGTGTFSEGGGIAGGFGGSGPLDVRLMSLLIRIPLDPVGAGGTGRVGAAALMLTVTGHLWTTGRAEVTGLSSATPNGFANTAALTGFDDRTAGHLGTLLLVTPFRVLVNSFSPLSGFASQPLRFVPEPGVLVLMVPGIIGLALLGRRRG